MVFAYADLLEFSLQFDRTSQIHLTDCRDLHVFTRRSTISTVSAWYGPCGDVIFLTRLEIKKKKSRAKGIDKREPDLDVIKRKQNWVLAVKGTLSQNGYGDRDEIYSAAIHR